MEDSHIADNSLPNQVSCYGVFDGHGGSEVSKFVAKHFVKELIKQSAFKQKDYSAALKANFI